jgi:hypothetical protein
MLSKVKKIGVVFNQVGPNQLYYQFALQANRLLSQRDDVDISGYWINDGPRTVQPNFALMPLFEAYAFHGITVATSLNTCARVLEYPGPNRYKCIYFYCFDLDWLRLQQKQYEQISSIYMHQKVQLIARSEDHAKIIESVWRRPFAVMENFDLSKIVDIL